MTLDSIGVFTCELKRAILLLVWVAKEGIVCISVRQYIFRVTHITIPKQTTYFLTLISVRACNIKFGELFSWNNFSKIVLLENLKPLPRLKCDGTLAETRFGLSEKWTSPFKSAGDSVQSTVGSRGVRISGQTMDRPCSEAQCKSSGYHL